MTGTVDAPVVGRVKKAYILIPVGLAGAYVAWRWYQASQEDTEPAPGADGMYTSDDLSEYGLSTSGGSTNVTGNTGNTETDGTTSDVDTNSEWNNKAVELLANSGYDPAAVRAALGEFLDRRALDKTEASIARAAIGAAGQPPENRPWSVLEEASTGTGTLAAPKNLRSWGNGPTDTTVPMQWDKVDGAAGYRVYRNLGENIGASLDTSFSARGLQPNTTYKFTVAAVSSTGKTGPQSATFTGKTKQVKLSRPTGLKASSITRTSFRVSCTPVKGASYYRWYVNGAASGASDSPYRDFTGRKPNTAYKITVAADTTTQEPGPTSAPLSVKTKK
jgi:hypothetical protein